MTWLDQIRARVFRPGESPEQADRRAFLFGATVTATGLLVAKPIVSVGRRAAGVTYFETGPTIHILLQGQSDARNNGVCVVTSVDRGRGIVTFGSPITSIVSADFSAGGHK